MSDVKHARYLQLTKWELLLSGIVSIVVGGLLYTWVLDRSYAGLVNAVAKANVIPRLLREDPAQSQSQLVEFSDAADAPRLIERARVRSLLRSLEVATRDDLEGTLENSDNALIWKVLQDGQVRSEVFDTADTRATSTVRAVAAMIVAVGDGSGFTESEAPGCAPSDNVAQLASLMALAIANPPVGISVANGPGAATYTMNGLRQRGDARAGLLAPAFSAGTLECSMLREMPTPWYVLLFRAPATVADAELLDAALYFSGAIDDTGWASTTYSTPADMSSEQAERLNRFMRGLMSELRNDPDVRQAQYVVTLFRGLEQLLEIVLALFVACILLRRSCKLRRFEAEVDKIDKALETTGRTMASADLGELLKDPTQRRQSIALYVAGVARALSGSAARDRTSAVAAAGTGAGASLRPATARVSDLRDTIEVEGEAMFSTGWPIRFGLAALPAIGFLGTVLGIMNALANADSIVRAPDRAAQAIAVVDIGGTLGLAFATTAIALALGLILRVFADWITARENTMISELETILVPLLDPAFWEAEKTGTAEPAKARG